MKDKIKAHWLKIVIVVVIIGIFAKWSNLHESLPLLISMNPSLLALAIITIILINIAKMLRFYYFADSIKLNIKFQDTLIAHGIAPILGRLTPAKLGEGMKILFLKSDKKQLGFAFIVEKLADTATLIIIAGFGVFTLGSFHSALWTIIGIGVGIIIGLLNLDKILGRLFKKDLLHDKWFKQSLIGVPMTQWIFFIASSTIIRFLILSIPYIVALAFEVAIPLTLIFQMYAISMLVGWVTGLPGGIGSREFSYSFLLVTYAALDPTTAGILSITVIVLDLLVESVLALLCLGLKQLNHKKEKN